MKIPISPNIRFHNPPIRPKYGLLNLFKENSNNYIKNISYKKKNIFSRNYNNRQITSFYYKEHLLNLANLIKKKFNKNISICEIGCGDGDFLNILKKKGFKKLSGFDKVYKGNNKNIKKRYLNSNDKLDFDLIVFRHVLSVVENPFELINLVKNITNEDSYILIDEDDFFWTEKNLAVWDLCYEQINYFNKETFANAFKKSFVKSMFFGQYFIFLSKLKYFDFDKKKDNWSKVNLSSYFKKFQSKVNWINKKKYKKIYIWGTGKKGNMYLYHLVRKNPSIRKIINVVDSDPFKENKYLSFGKYKIISPKKLLSILQSDDLIIVANNAYFKEIKTYISRNIKFKCKIIAL